MWACSPDIQSWRGNIVRMKRSVAFVAVCLLTGMLALAGFAARAESRKRDCVPQSETAELVAEHHLIRPVIVLRSASVQMGGEAVSAKLCRWGLAFVYEIAVLKKDGRITHAFINAATGDTETLTNPR